MSIQLAQILFQIFNFSVIFAAIYFFLNKPIAEILEKRAKKIEEIEKEKEEIEKNKEKIEENKTKILKKAKKDASELIAEENKKAKDNANLIITEAKEKAEKEVKSLENLFEEEKKEMIRELKSEFVDAVINTAEQVIEKTLDKKDHQDLINAEFDKFIAKQK